MAAHQHRHEAPRALAAFPRKRIIREIKLRCPMQFSMRNRNRTLGRLAIAAVLFVIGVSPIASAQTRIRLATLLPSGTSYHHSLQEMAAKWKQASNGTISVTIYADGTMGSEDEIVRRMRVGQLQAAFLTVSGISEIDPSV